MGPDRALGARVSLSASIRTPIDEISTGGKGNPVKTELLNCHPPLSPKNWLSCVTNLADFLSLWKRLHA